MSSETKKYANYQDLLTLPEHVVGEIIAGELVTSPRPGSEHAHASSKLGRKVGVPFDDGIGGPGGWWILDEPEVHLQRDILVPDLAGWRLDLHQLTSRGENKFMDEKFEIKQEWLPRGKRTPKTRQLPFPRSVRLTKELDMEVTEYLSQNGLSFGQLCTFAIESFINRNQAIVLKTMRQTKQNDNSKESI